MVDGCNTFSALWRVLMPAVKPGLITVGLFAFLAAWNDFFAPLILINDTNRMTLPLAVSNLRGQVQGVVDYGATEAGVVVLARAVHPSLPDPPTSLRARLHVRRLQGMTMTFDHAPTTPSRPRAGLCVRSASTRCGSPAGSGADARTSTAARRSRTSAAGSSARAGSATSTSRHPDACPRGAAGREFSDSEVYKYLEAVAWEIGRIGGAEPTPRSRRASALSSPGSRRRRSRTAT